MGRSKTAEEELSDYPIAFKTKLSNMLSELQSAPNELLQERYDLNDDDFVRDGFQYYFIEYEGHRAEIRESVTLQDELKGLLTTLKERLKY